MRISGGEHSLPALSARSFSRVKSSLSCSQRRITTVTTASGVPSANARRQPQTFTAVSDSDRCSTPATRYPTAVPMNADDSGTHASTALRPGGAVSAL